MIDNVEWLLFDFGGCLDSDGLHSRAIFFHLFVQSGVVDSDEWELFQDAYSYADKKAVKESLLVNMNLSQMNRQLSLLINEQLNRLDDEQVYAVADRITSFQSEYLNRNRGVLLGLVKKFKLGIISNFSGNLEIILDEFKMLDIFDFVLDSYHVGVAKPDSKIFKLALEKCGVSADKICYMGDNAIRDIIPAHKLGFKTIHIYNAQESRIKTKKCSPDAIVESLVDIKMVLQNCN